MTKFWWKRSGKIFQSSKSSHEIIQNRGKSPLLPKGLLTGWLLKWRSSTFCEIGGVSTYYENFFKIQGSRNRLCLSFISAIWFTFNIFQVKLNDKKRKSFIFCLLEIKVHSPLAKNNAICIWNTLFEQCNIPKVLTLFVMERKLWRKMFTHCF